MVLGDTHLPWINWQAIEHAADHARSYKPDCIVQVGDLIDGYNWSMYKKAIDSPNAAAEWDQTELAVNNLRNKFKKDIQWHILEGNHCRRYMMRATEVNIPRKLIRSLDEIFPYDNFKWHVEPRPLVLDGVSFIHGDEMAGNAWQKAQRMGQNLCQGHDHLGYLQYIQTFKHRIFGMSVGTLMDTESIVGRYAAKNCMRSWIGHATITDGVPQLHPFLR